MPTPMPIDREASLRYERKFHARDVTPARLELLVKLHPAHFLECYPPRFVNNIYFDSARLDTFSQHVNGASSRRKFRIRWYGDPHGRVQRPVLEVKSRHGMVGDKHQYPLAPIDFDGPVPVASIRKLIETSVRDSDVVGTMASFLPALLNRYRRRYYRTSDGRFRLTIDTDMSFHTVDLQRYGFRDEHHERRLSVCELKYGVRESERAPDIAALLPFRMSKLSKYVYGLTCLGKRED